MRDTYFAAGSTLATLKAPVSVTATGATAGIDITPYRGAMAAVLTSLNTAGTSPTLAVKLQHAQDVDLIGTVAYSGTGDGTLTEVWAGIDAVTEDITLTASNATTFAVSGSVSGSLGNATVGTKFTSAKVSFLITAGETDFESADAFTIPVTARTWSDVSGGAFTGLTTGAAIQRISVDADRLGGHLRIYGTIGGTDNPAYTIGVALLAMPQVGP